MEQDEREDGDTGEVKEWAEQNFKAMKKKFDNITQEMRNSKPRENINVRRVDAENLKNQDEDQIIVEYSVERWYSINYFKRMLEGSGTGQQKPDSDEETLF